MTTLIQDAQWLLEQALLAYRSGDNSKARDELISAKEAIEEALGECQARRTMKYLGRHVRCDADLLDS